MTPPSAPNTSGTESEMAPTRRLVSGTSPSAPAQTRKAVIASTPKGIVSHSGTVRYAQDRSAASAVSTTITATRIQLVTAVGTSTRADDAPPKSNVVTPSRGRASNRSASIAAAMARTIGTLR